MTKEERQIVERLRDYASIRLSLGESQIASDLTNLIRIVEELDNPASLRDSTLRGQNPRPPVYPSMNEEELESYRHDCGED